MPFKSKNKRKKYNKDWKKKNKGKQKEYNAKWRAKLKEWYHNYKNSSPCIICGESRWACLEAHHVHPQYKSFSIHEGVKSGISIRRLESEATKCVILCCLHHRLYHMKAFNKEEQEKWDNGVKLFEKNNGTHFFGQPTKPPEKKNRSKSTVKIRTLTKKYIKGDVK